MTALLFKSVGLDTRLMTCTLCGTAIHENFTNAHVWIAHRSWFKTHKTLDNTQAPVIDSPQSKENP